MMVKSARTKIFDDEIDLIFVNRIIRIYTGRFNNLCTNHSAEFQAIQMMCFTLQIIRF